MESAPQTIRALLVEDQEEDAQLLLEALRRGGYAPSWKRVNTEPDLRAALAAQEWDVVFCNYSSASLNAAAALRVLREDGDTLTAIVVSGQSGEEVAVEAMRLGANDFILRNNLARVVPAIERELGAAGLRRERNAAALALKQSEERYRTLFDESPWPMWVYDPVTLRYLAANERALREYGYSREEYLGMTIKDLSPAEDVAELLESFAQMKTPLDDRPRATRRHQKKDGSVITVEIVSQPITFNGSVARVVQAVDITARCEAEQALQESETMLRQAYGVQKALFNALPAHIAVVDREGVIRGVNAGWERYAAAGEPRPTNFYLGESYIRVCEEGLGVAAKDAKAIAVGLRGVLEGHLRQFSCEYACHAPGEKAWFRLSITPLDDGKEQGAVVMHLAITDRMQAELLLRDSEERFRQMAENSEDVFWLIDANAKRLIYISPAYEKIWGRPQAELQVSPGAFLDAIHEDDRAMVATAFENTAGKYVLTYRIVRPTGECRWIYERAYPVRNEAGEIYRLAGIATDITEIKQAEERIVEQAALLDHAQDAIFVQDLEGKISYWNKSAARVFGWTAEEALGRRVQDLLFDNAQAYQLSLEMTRKRGDWIGEVSTRTKAGSQALIECRWTLLRDEAGESRAILAINTDITENKKLEEHLFRAQRMESIGTLAGGIAHDLNNVLGPIIMGVDLLKLRLTEPQDRDLLELMETSGQRGVEMVKQVLFFARGVEGRRSRVAPAELFDEMRRIIRDTFPKSIIVKVEAPEDTWKISGDRTQLHQVLLNLCVNARDAMPKGGRLHLRASNREVDAHFAAMDGKVHPGAYVQLEVADTGEGMPPEVLAQMFDPFFTTKGPEKGTGLGLSTTRGIVEGHGGFIIARSTVGTGTIFQVNFPAETGPAEVHPEGRVNEIPRGNGETVLIIEDEAAIRSITAQTLEAYGYRVLSAGDGADGVVKYVQDPGEVAIVLTDMMMPVLDGTTTIRALFRIDPLVKIIATSGSKDGGESLRINKGVKRFLQKPYTAESLLRMLDELLKGREAAVPAVPSSPQN